MRTGVGVILLNNKRQVFVGKRLDNPVDNWQMPQGGVDPGEDFHKAMRRELYEETSIKNVKIIKEIKKMYEYVLPKKLIGIIWKGKYKGQKQKWFILEFKGNDNEINIKTKDPEFIEWKWINVEMLPEVIVDFKKDLYINLLKEIKQVIG